MMRKALLFLMISLILLPMAAAQDEQAQSGINWLLSQQAEDGSFDEGNLGLTALAALALASAGQPNDTALTWLETYVLEHTEELTLSDVSSLLITVIASGENPDIFADGLLLDQHRLLRRELSNEHVLDYCWSDIAIFALGQEFRPTTINVLLQLQNRDGGFGDAAGELSNPIVTSICIQALAAMQEQEAVQRALGYLRITQNQDQGWSYFEADTSDSPTTALSIMALIAARENLEDWGNPLFTLMRFQDTETGAFVTTASEVDNIPNNLGTTALVLMVLNNRTFITAQPGVESTLGMTIETADGSIPEGPSLSVAWEAVASLLNLVELNSADDFFVTATDPFADERHTGIDIINWAADYEYTQFLIEKYLPAEVLLWIADQDPTAWEQISEHTLQLLPESVLSQVLAAMQEKVGQE